MSFVLYYKPSINILHLIFDQSLYNEPWDNSFILCLLEMNVQVNVW